MKYAVFFLALTSRFLSLLISTPLPKLFSPTLVVVFTRSTRTNATAHNNRSNSMTYEQGSADQKTATQVVLTLKKLHSIHRRGRSKLVTSRILH